MYSLPDYGRMVGEPVRFAAYRRALERAIQPGDVVIDLGAGPGVFALLAARADAAVVYAVEPDPVAQLIAPLAERNGVGDRVVVVPELSTAWTPERRADVIISDLRGILPTFTDHLPSIIDARTRLLRPGGTLIPARDEIWAAPVHAPRARHRHLGGFGAVPGLDLEPARKSASHFYCRVELDEEAMVAPPVRLAELDYPAVTDLNLRGEARWRLPEASIDGIAVWFDAFLDDLEGYSNAPSDSQMIYGQAFFPLPHAYEARDGDHLELRFSAHHNPDDYLFRWRGHFESRGGERRGSFDQSTFYGLPVTPAELEARSPSFVPSVGPEAAIDAEILRQLDGRRSLGDVAEHLLRVFPEQFQDAHSALKRVTALSDRYSV